MIKLVKTQLRKFKTFMKRKEEKNTKKKTKNPSLVFFISFLFPFNQTTEHDAKVFFL